MNTSLVGSKQVFQSSITPTTLTLNPFKVHSSLLLNLPILCIAHSSQSLSPPVLVSVNKQCHYISPPFKDRICADGAMPCLKVIIVKCSASGLPFLSQIMFESRISSPSLSVDIFSSETSIHSFPGFILLPVKPSLFNTYNNLLFPHLPLPLPIPFFSLPTFSHVFPAISAFLHSEWVLSLHYTL